MSHRLERHACAIRFAVCGISGDVWRSEKHLSEQVAVNTGFALPSVNYGSTHTVVVKRLAQSSAINYLPATCINKHGATLQALQKGRINKVVRRVRPIRNKGCMDGDNITFRLQLLERSGTQSEVRLTLSTRRVVEQDATAHALQALHNATTHVAHTYDTHRAIRKIDFSRFRQEQQGTLHVLRHTRSVTPRAIGPRNTCLTQVIYVEVVVTNRGGGNELHL
jgi:hypothetical protein